jgi:hypothetical protein
MLFTSVLPTVNFDNELRASTLKVHDIRRDWGLAAEMVTERT